MIESISLGIDIVDINRFKKLDSKKNSKFFERVFSKSEIQYCIEFKNSSEHFAGKFAIKESVRKCVGNKIKFKDIITDHKKSKPIVKIKNKPEYLFQVSISHEKNIAVAVVLCEKSTR
jgi:holo-[acyl-carrier protein] synthase|tara:strand:+ start:156 stop:509 length:354 start_codon:yes stop_codon:yes gene_type:complete